MEIVSPREYLVFLTKHSTFISFATEITADGSPVKTKAVKPLFVVLHDDVHSRFVAVEYPGAWYAYLLPRADASGLGLWDSFNPMLHPVTALRFVMWVEKVYRQGLRDGTLKTL